MKLIYCPNCGDIVRLMPTRRWCLCRKCYGEYLNDIDAYVSGPCHVLGIHNTSFYKALGNPDREDGMGNEFNSFVIPRNTGRIVRE